MGDTFGERTALFDEVLGGVLFGGPRLAFGPDHSPYVGLSQAIELTSEALAADARSGAIVRASDGGRAADALGVVLL